MNALDRLAVHVVSLRPKWESDRLDAQVYVEVEQIIELAKDAGLDGLAAYIDGNRPSVMLTAPYGDESDHVSASDLLELHKHVETLVNDAIDREDETVASSAPDLELSVLLSNAVRFASKLAQSKMVEAAE